MLFRSDVEWYPGRLGRCQCDDEGLILERDHILSKPQTVEIGERTNNTESMPQQSEANKSSQNLNDIPAWQKSNKMLFKADVYLCLLSVVNICSVPFLHN